jgi:hypothetical protein
LPRAKLLLFGNIQGPRHFAQNPNKTVSKKTDMCPLKSVTRKSQFS